MINDHDKVKVYEGNREARTLTGMIFELSLQEYKDFNWNFDNFYYIVEGMEVLDKSQADTIFKKLNTTNH